MTPRQQRIIDLMQARPERDLYEGSAPPNARLGSGEFWLTYSADEHYQPLRREDVDALVQLGVIVERWPDCYKLAGAERRDPKGNSIK